MPVRLLHTELILISPRYWAIHFFNCSWLGSLYTLCILMLYGKAYVCTTKNFVHY